MVSWRDKLQPASFRGVRFYVKSHEDKISSPRYVRHEYPEKDKAYHEPTGKHVWGASFQGYIVADMPGADYYPDRDRFLDALEKTGPGNLIHPNHGTKNVVVAEPPTLREANGVADFSLSFEETSEPAVPEPVPNHDDLVEENAEALNTEAAAAFGDAYDITGPSFLKDGFIADVVNFAESAADMIGTIPEMVNQSAVGQMLDALEGIDSSISGVIYQADGVSAFLQNKVKGLGNLSNYSQTYASFNIAMELLKWGSESNPSSFGTTLPAIVGTTANKQKQQENRDALLDLMHRAALSEACVAALNIDYLSKDQVDYVNSLLADALDAELIRAGDRGDDEAYQVLRDLQRNMNGAILSRAGDLPEVISWKVPAKVLPALVLAHDRYQDLSREQEILDRNPFIEHPGFIPGGVNLELLAS